MPPYLQGFHHGLPALNHRYRQKPLASLPFRGASEQVCAYRCRPQNGHLQLEKMSLPHLFLCAKNSNSEDQHGSGGMSAASMELRSSPRRAKLHLLQRVRAWRRSLLISIEMGLSCAGNFIWMWTVRAILCRSIQKEVLFNSTSYFYASVYKVIAWNHMHTYMQENQVIKWGLHLSRHAEDCIVILTGYLHCITTVPICARTNCVAQMDVATNMCCWSTWHSFFSYAYNDSIEPACIISYSTWRKNRVNVYFGEKMHKCTTFPFSFILVYMQMLKIAFSQVLGAGEGVED